MKKTKFFSFKTKLIIVVELFIFSIALVLGFVAYSSQEKLIRQVSEKKLLAIASSTAAVIDGDQVAAIQTEEDTESDNFSQIKDTLRKIQEDNADVDDIYLMRKTVYRNILRFIMGAADTEDTNGNGIIEENEEGVAFDEDYDISPYPQMLQAFDRPTTDSKTNCDKWGCWLSGYAPIKNSEGETVAIVGVDIPAQDVISYENDTRNKILISLVIVSLIFPLFLLIYLEYVLWPISKIVNAIREFSSNLKSRIEVNRDDEFGLIARTFNQMALDLEVLYTQMEKRVAYKTKEIADVAEKALEEKAKEEAFLESVGEGMIAIDNDGKVIIANKQTEKILEKPSDEIIGKTISELYDVADELENKLAEEEKPLQKVLYTGKKVSGKYYCLHDGKKIPVFITATPVICEGKQIGAILVFRDITRESEIDRAKTEFVSLASHQLRTPLSIISWHSEAMLEDQEGLSKKQQGYLQKIAHATDRMVALVKALLNTSRLEMGTFSIESKEVDLIKLADTAIDESAPLRSIQNISVEKKFSSDSIMTKGDPQLLNMIFQNLLSNAAKYSKRDGQVVLEIAKDDQNIIIRVSDSGIGITKSQQDQIFTRFFRADNAKEKEADGTGLGLYIIKSIIDNSGGTISFESVEDKGTTFTVTLPGTGMPGRAGTRRLI